MTIRWRANVSGSATDLTEEADILALVNGLCVALGATGLYISDGLIQGARVLPIEDQ